MKTIRGRADSFHRLRVGDYCVMYDLVEEERALLVLGIVHRSDLERSLRSIHSVEVVALRTRSTVALKNPIQQLERAAQAQRDAEDDLFADLTKTQRAQRRRLLLILREQHTAEADTACAAADANTRS